MTKEDMCDTLTRLTRPGRIDVSETSTVLPKHNFIDVETAEAISAFCDDMYLCFRAPEMFAKEFGQEKFDEINTAQMLVATYARTRLYAMIAATEGPIHVANAVQGAWTPISPIVTVERIIHLRILYGHFAYNYYSDMSVYENFGSLAQAIRHLAINLPQAQLYKQIDRYAKRGWYWTDPTEKDERSRMIAPTRMAEREWQIATVCNVLGLARHQEWRDIARDIESFTAQLSGYLQNWASTFEGEFGMPVEGIKDFDLGVMPPLKFDVKH